MAAIIRRIFAVVVIAITTSGPLTLLAARMLPSQEALFWEPHPLDAALRARRALRAIESGQPEASEEITRLGGAGLPALVPELDRVDALTRKTVLLALAPVAVRMRLEDAMRATQPELASAFWQDFWTRRSLEFTPENARLQLRRFIENPSAPRARQVRQLDTYALAFVGEVLPAAPSAEDRDHLIAVSAVLREAIASSLSAEAMARACAEDCSAMWRRFAIDEGLGFRTLTDSERLIAHVGESRFGRVWRHWFSALSADSPRMRQALRGTLWDVFASFIRVAFLLVGGRGIKSALVGLTQSKRHVPPRIAAAISFCIAAALVLATLPRRAWGPFAVAALVTAAVADDSQADDMASSARGRHILTSSELWRMLSRHLVRVAGEWPRTCFLVLGLESYFSVPGMGQVLLEATNSQRDASIVASFILLLVLLSWPVLAQPPKPRFERRPV